MPCWLTCLGCSSFTMQIYIPHRRDKDLLNEHGKDYFHEWLPLRSKPIPWHRHAHFPLFNGQFVSLHWDFSKGFRHGSILTSRSILKIASGKSLEEPYSEWHRPTACPLHLPAVTTFQILHVRCGCAADRAEQETKTRRKWRWSSLDRRIHVPRTTYTMPIRNYSTWWARATTPAKRRSERRLACACAPDRVRIGSVRGCTCTGVDLCQIHVHVQPPSSALVWPLLSPFACLPG
jgi:hypothetical protein